MDVDKARTRFAELRGHRDVSPADLDEIWAALDTARAEDMLGSWKGDEFHTGHKMNGQLAAARWYGKIFRSINDVEPIVCYDDEGKLFSNNDLSLGGATLWDIEFRGEVTGTMVYDGQPTFDHFKWVDENTLMGIMNGKRQRASGNYLYFILERDQ
ncbi:DUF4334 domain-containing protein [Mycobacteroides chelonae]|jgi:hypothetical protein|uniref:DUF4334 domain-containing protein n=1 Tax=Mycobacteroides chelonae TaxID=1774 RepID=UPI0008A90A4A|nr:DUF4334 domain-containing protein [Mycobacteroides chelonae]MBF9318517.1 DUF4334 domain-containing protein [Mycobacteroides chelonae]MBF9349903.1 DUF4334 domain-containing protein [Mycobacteroides chelonae]OHU42092.1 hypothetical protein BKG80_03915 [Mycobacteroides chelonae]